VAEVDLNVVCKNCGSEVSPYITECPYCGQRLRKRAPKLRQEGEGVELVPPRRRRRLRLSRRRRAEDRPLAWLSAQRPYATIALVLAGAALLITERASTLGVYDLGALIGPLDGDWWRLVAAQFVYENVGYLFVVAVTVAIFGGSIERRYGPLVMLAVFLGAGAAGMYVASEAVTLPVAMGGNAGALGLLGAWVIRDFRDRRAGQDPETDLFGVAAIGAVLIMMPILETTADAWAGLGGAVVGCLAGLLLPQRS
jgi:membrane associated rhomboid family serine protease